MKIIEQFFEGFKCEKDKLLPFGFTEKEGVFTLVKDFLDGDFRMEITVDGQGEISGKVIENDTAEEYFPLDVEDFSGGFVEKIKEQLRALLSLIKEACFTQIIPVGKQAEEIKKLIEKTYGEKPDNPFSDDFISTVFRYPATKKWYALFMRIDGKKVGETGEKDVVNVKIDETKSSEIFKRNGVLPAYHMNKKKWASIILDGRLENEEIMSFIDVSRSFALKK